MSVGAIINSFFIPVLCGYVLIQLVPKLKLHVTAHSENGYRLIMRSLLYGLLYVFIVIFLVEFFRFISAEWTFAHGLLSLKGVSNLSPINIIGKIFSEEKLEPTYIFWAFFPLLARFFIQKKYNAKKIRQEEREIEEQYLIDNGDHFIYKTIDSQRNGRFVIITLKSRKVYTGFIAERPRILSNVGRKSLVIWPITSGYRDDKTLKFVKTNFYWIFYEVQDRKQKIEEFFSKNPDKKYLLEVTVNKKKHSISFDRDEFDHLKDKFGVTVEWDEIDSIISYISAVQQSST